MGTKPTKEKSPKEKSTQKTGARSARAHSVANVTTSSHHPNISKEIQSFSTTDIINSNKITANGNTALTSSSDSKRTKTSLSNPSLKKADSDAFSIKRLEELYAKYMDQDEPDHIGPENMARFCRDLEVDPENIEMLLLAWHLDAKEMAYFTKKEFLTGFQKMGVDSLPKIKTQLKALPVLLDDPVKYKEVYKYAFSFAKEKDQKVIELQLAEEMIKLVMGDRFPHTTNFLQFLKQQTSYKAINLDQWMNFLEFSKTIQPDFSNYDENSAWPVLLDEFVEWQKARNENPPPPSE